MTILNIKLNTSEIDILSIRETCELCKYVTKHILTYFREVLMIHSPAERTCISKHQQYILACIDLLGNSRPHENNESDDNCRIYFHNFLYIAANSEQHASTFKVLLEPSSYQLAGPVALIKLLRTFVGSTLISLDYKAPFSQNNDLIGKCLKGVDRVANSLLNILAPINKKHDYLVQESTHLSSILVTIEREIIIQAD